MKQKTRFKNFGNIGTGLKKAISVDLYRLHHGRSQGAFWPWPPKYIAKFTSYFAYFTKRS